MKKLEEIQEIIKKIIANELAISPQEIVPTSSFYDLGLDSVNSIFLLAEMETTLDIHIDPMSVYDNPTIESFSKYLHNSLLNGAE